MAWYWAYFDSVLIYKNSIITKEFKFLLFFSCIWRLITKMEERCVCTRRDDYFSFFFYVRRKFSRLRVSAVQTTLSWFIGKSWMKLSFIFSRVFENNFLRIFLDILKGTFRSALVQLTFVENEKKNGDALTYFFSLIFLVPSCTNENECVARASRVLLTLVLLYGTELVCRDSFCECKWIVLLSIAWTKIKGLCGLISQRKIVVCCQVWVLLLVLLNMLDLKCR